MKSRPVLLLLAAAGLLVLLIAGEWIVGLARIGRIEAPPHATASRSPARQAAVAQIGPDPDDIDAWLHSILARPLMSATRTPASRPGGPALALNGGLPRLAGTVAGGDQGAAAGIAIFARDDGGHPLILHQGGLLGPYRVTRIMPNSVTLQGPAGTQTLRPRFGTAAASITPGAVPLGTDDAPPIPGSLPGVQVPGMAAPGFPQANFPGLVPRMPNGLPPQQPQASPP